MRTAHVLLGFVVCLAALTGASTGRRRTASTTSRRLPPGMGEGLALVMALSAIALIAWTLAAHRGRACRVPGPGPSVPRHLLRSVPAMLMTRPWASSSPRRSPSVIPAT